MTGDPFFEAGEPASEETEAYESGLDSDMLDSIITEDQTAEIPPEEITPSAK